MRSGARRPATIPGVCGLADIGFSLLQPFSGKLAQVDFFINW
jgi:hypothetical protein